MARILSFGTYPVSVPRHGGQVRVNALHQNYRAAGHDVRHLALYRADEYPDEPASEWDIHFTWPFINELIAVGGRTDINAPDFLLREAGACTRMRELVLDFEPDLIQLEHCWMWPIVKMIRGASSQLCKVPLVYSSHNVEHQLLDSAVRRGTKPIAEDIVSLVKDMEMDLASSADLVVVVSDADAEVFEPVSRQVIVAPNGIWPKPPGTGQNYWSKELLGRRFGLFVGSAHPPNAAGFLDFLGPTLGFLSPTELVVVVGGVCNLLRSDSQFRQNIGLNLARSMLVGAQDAGGLSTFIDMADVVIVPITEGGGTNIKMAEALYNRKLLICTAKATRGYEAFLDLPYVLVRNTPEEFKATLLAALRGEFDNRLLLNRSQAERLKTLLWSSTLAELTAQIGQFVSR